MSLLTTASPWNSGNTKKRTPTMRKTIKKMTYADNDANEDSYENFEPASGNTIEKSQMINESRNVRVAEMLNKMDSLNVDNVGSKLADFNPPPSPELTSQRPHSDKFTGEITSPDELLPQNPIMPPIPSFFEQAQKRKIPVKPITSYGSNDIGLTQFSNYNTSYDGERVMRNIADNKPYYSKMGISGSSDDKLMEKLNYMIHLLEEQQHEKTSNVMEEFILYTFLGVFVIFISDSFARAGKYVR
jgi:hypothetical protein